MKLNLLLLLFTVLTAACTKAQLAIPGFDHELVGKNLHIIKYEGYSTNIGVYVDEESIVLIDPVIGHGKEEELLAAIQTISKKPIKYVLNTHSHPDHSGNNKFFADRGATIISQENARYSSAFHQITYKKSYTLHLKSNELNQLLGVYTFDGEAQSEVVALDGRLRMRRAGAYIIELVPLTKTKFHVRGKVPQQTVTFSLSVSTLSNKSLESSKSWPSSAHKLCMRAVVLSTSPVKKISFFNAPISPVVTSP